MIDLIKATRVLSNEEMYAIDWFNKHGFEGTLDRQFPRKAKFSVGKNGVTDKFELLCCADYDIAAYMEQYGRSFEMLCELTRLRAEMARQRAE